MNQVIFCNAEGVDIYPPPPNHAHAWPQRYHIFRVQYIITSPEMINVIQFIFLFLVNHFPFFSAPPKKNFPI